MKPKTKHNPNVKTPDQVRAEFAENGISVAEWARTHNVSRATVYQVLALRKKGLRGDAHKVAVLLGLKAGRLNVAPADMASAGLPRSV